MAVQSETRDDTRDVEAEMADGPTAEAQMADRIAKLEREIALRDARDEVRTLSEARVVEDADKLVELRMRDEVAFGIVAGALPERPQPTERKARGGGATVIALADRKPSEIARDLQAQAQARGENLSFTDARSQALVMIREATR